MTNPTPQQLERLKEIAKHDTKTIRECLSTFHRVVDPLVNVYGETEPCSLIELAMRELALTVWREAQEEKEQLQNQLALHCACQHDERGELTTKCQYHEHLEEDKQQLESSLRLAVEAARRLIANYDADNYSLPVQAHQAHRDLLGLREALSTIKTNHPQLMEEKK